MITSALSTSRVRRFALSAVLAALTGAATAVPITSGTLGMAFTYQAENAAGTNVSLGVATAIDFSALQAGPPSAANTGSFNVLQATGSFGANGVAVGQVGTIRDLVFGPFSPISPFFTIGPVSFNMAGLTINAQMDSGLNLSGTGTFVVGTDVTAGTWGFSAQTTGSDLIGTFSWSADASPMTTPIPEPETYALMLAGLGVLGFVAKRRRTG